MAWQLMARVATIVIDVRGSRCALDERFRRQAIHARGWLPVFGNSFKRRGISPRLQGGRTRGGAWAGPAAGVLVGGGAAAAAAASPVSGRLAGPA